MRALMLCFLLLLPVQAQGPAMPAAGQTAPSAGPAPGQVTPGATQPVAAPDPIPTPDPDQPTRLDVTRAVTLALQASPTLAEYRARVREAAYRIDEASAGYFPRLGFQAGYSNIQPEVSFPGDDGSNIIITPSNNYNLRLVLDQAIYTFGRLEWATAAAELTELSIREQYRREIENLMLTTALEFGAAILANQAVEIAQANLKARELQLRDAQTLFEAGKVARFDVLRGETDLSNARQTLIQAQTRHNLANARLLSRLNLPPTRKLELVPLSVERTFQPDQAAGREQAVQERPELQALDFAIQAAEARVNLVGAELNPNLSLRTLAEQRTASGFTPSQQVTTGLVLDIPIFDGGLTPARVAQGKEVVEQLTQSREETRRAVLLEVDQAYLDLISAQEQLKVARQTTIQATESERVAQVRYRSGVSTSLELQDAITELSRARFGEATAELDFFSAQCRWYRAVSGKSPIPIPDALYERTSPE